MFLPFRRTPPPPAFDPTALMAELQILRQQGKTIMDAIGNLQAADAALGQSVTAALASIKTQGQEVADLSAKLTAALASGQSAGDRDAQLQTIADDLNTKAQALNDAIGATHEAVTTSTADTSATAAAATGA